MLKLKSLESSAQKYSYDVFLSFSGEDTRKTFTDHLYAALIHEGLITFRDDEEIERGESIKSELEKGIQQSRSWIIVFSKNYAFSRWCLDELVLILECGNKSKRLVLPIFFHVDPSDVRKQSGCISEALYYPEEKFKREVDETKRKNLLDKIKRWRIALTDVANLAGMPLQNVANGIKHPVAKKTILQIMRSTWPRGLFTYRQIVAGNPKWITDVITEFNNYYTHKEGEQTEQGAYESIYKHVQSEMKHTLNESKKKAKADAKRLNKTLFEVNPGIFDDEFWKELVEYWNSEAHGHLSEVGSKNREKIKSLHSAGAKSFTEMEDEYVAKVGKKPPQLWWYKKTHLKKNGKRVEIDELPCDSDFMTDESRLIAARYADIVERNRDWFASQPGGEEEATHPLQWWIEATAPGCARPPRNQLICFPRIPASTLIPDLAANYRAQRVGGAGSSSQANQGSGSVIPDPLFINVVRNVLNEAQANPGAYHTPPTFAQVSNIANAALEMQRNPEMGSQAFSNAIVGEVTRLVGEILQSIYNKYEIANAEAIRRAQGGADDGGEDDGGEDNGGEGHGGGEGSGGEGSGGDDDGGYRDDGMFE